MTFSRICTAIFILASGTAMAQDAPLKLQCEGKIQRENPKTESQMEPYSVEIGGKAVKLIGVGDLETNYSLIQKDERFYVFKNAKKTQGGNLNRATGQLSLYALDKGSHKIAISVAGLCTKEN
jgi:hypothetical protein